MDNISAFQANQYDANDWKVIPFYDKIYQQIFDVIQIYFENQKISVLDTGGGTGNFGLQASRLLNLSELVLCDPSEKMLADAEQKFKNHSCEFFCIGSENLPFENHFDLITAIQSHHYFDKNPRKQAVQNCFRALKSGGMFICFENTAPFSETGKIIMLNRLEKFGLQAGRTPEEVKSHSMRYNQEFFPITIQEHLDLLRNAGFQTAELFWHSYMQSGFYAIK